MDSGSSGTGSPGTGSSGRAGGCTPGMRTGVVGDTPGSEAASLIEGMFVELG